MYVRMQAANCDAGRGHIALSGDDNNERTGGGRCRAGNTSYRVGGWMRKKGAPL